MAAREPYLTTRSIARSTEIADVADTESPGPATQNKVAAASHVHKHPTGLDPDAHHAESHAHDGADGSGTVSHGDLTDIAADDHHNQEHGSEDHSDDYAAALAGLRVLTGPTSYTLADTDGVVICDAAAGDITINLPALTETVDPPAAGSAGKVYAFYRKDSSNNDVLFTPNGSDVILGDNHLPGIGQRSILVADTTAAQNVWAPLTSGRGPLTVTKPSDTSRSSTTTLADDPHLTFPVENAGVYIIQGLLFYQAGTTGDLKVTIAAPGSSGGGWSTTGISGNSGYNQAVGTGNDLVPLGTSRSVGGAGAGLYCCLAFTAVVVAGGAGDVRVQWAQDVSDGTATIVKAGSALWYQRANT